MIAIVIVGYNSLRFLRTCLDAIFSSTNKDFQVIFVDNQSSDESVDFIAKYYPKVKLIVNQENYGFAKANNIGIAAAKELGAQAIFLLNPDTALAPDCLAILKDHFDPATVLQPAILLDPVKQTNKINTTGGELSVLGFSYCSDYKRPIDQVAEEQERPLASGAAVCFPTKILEKIGGFDELFFMYVEDADLAYRARLAGYTIKLVPTAKVWHDYSFGRNTNKMYYAERNRLIFLAKNFSHRYLILLAPLFWITELGVMLFMAKDGMLGAKLRTYGSVVKLWPAIHRERQRVQALRRKTDRELATLMADKVQFSEVAIPLLKPYNMFVGLYWRLMRTLL